MEYLMEEWNSHYNMLLNNRLFNNRLHHRYLQPSSLQHPEPQKSRTQITLMEPGPSSPISLLCLPSFSPQILTDITMMQQK